jgi:hypothetical protein
MSIRSLALILMLATMSAACAVEGPAEDIEEQEQAPAHELEVGTHAFSIAAASFVQLEAAGSWVDADGESRTIALPIIGGSAEVTTDGETLDLEALTVALEDLEVGTSIVTPDGGRLTELRLVLDGPVSADVVVENGDVVGYVDLGLRLEWRLELPSGKQVDLGSPEIADMPCRLRLRPSADGSAALEIALSHEGDLLTLDSAIVVTSLALRVEGEAM